MSQYKVGYIIGSLAARSINRKLARALVRLAPPELEMAEIGFKELPLYSYDYDESYPEVALRFKEAIAASDAVLFVTPEYNRSIPGGLKNAIDWASRPYGKNSFSRKPSTVIGASPGKIGTAIAQTSLRSVLCYCNSPLMNSPEAYIQFTPDLITEGGQVTNKGTEDFLRGFMSEFHRFIVRVYTVLPRTPSQVGRSLRSSASSSLRRKHKEAVLDQALADSFPASDPVSTLAYDSPTQSKHRRT